jgi:hypothetical protein
VTSVIITKLLKHDCDLYCSHRFIYLIGIWGEAGIALGYGLDDREFESLQGLVIFFFTTASRTVLGPTQPPIQCVTGTLFLGVKRPGREADHSPPSNAEVKNAWS